MINRLEATYPDELIVATYTLPGAANHWVNIDGSNERLFEVTTLYAIRETVFHEYFMRAGFYPNATGYFEAPWEPLELVPVSP